jgi:peptidoglycan DL-endopeptidase CwlO
VPERKPEPRPGRSEIPRAGLGRRTTLAVACVLAVLGGPAVSAAAYAAPPAPQGAPAAGDLTRQSTPQPTPQPSPGVPPSPGPAPDRTADGHMDGGGPGGGSASGGDSGGAGDDDWSPVRPEADADESAEDAASPSRAPSGEKTGGPDGNNRDGEPTLQDVRERLAALHDRAGSATDAYNAAEAQAEAQREEIADLERRMETTEKRLGELEKRAGALARAQYRGGGMPAAARLMLSDDPEDFLRDAGLARQGQQAAKGLVTSLTETSERLDRYTRDAKKRYAELEEQREEKAAARKRIRKQLKQAEKLESRLAADERARLRELERQAAYARQLRWLRSGVLAEIQGKASAQGREAIAYATAQIGKDYEWGAEGPTTYDCSGLTMRAWEAAGVSVPRTSQQQWRRLPRVQVTDMRPGDLIVYKADASHVGMYLGDGVMVHAPRTGRQITIEGAGSYPILGVVRPDK